MIRRLYVHNFRCLQNFTFDLAGQQAALLVGRNGVGKTTIALALELIQKICRGRNRMQDLVWPSDLHFGAPNGPAVVEIEAEVAGLAFKYAIAFEFPPDFRELRVHSESFHVGGAPVFSRLLSEVKIGTGPSFGMDWHLAALPVIQEKSTRDPLHIFKTWMASSLILRPIPTLIEGTSDALGSLFVEPSAANLGSWFTALVALAPASYGLIDRFLRARMPDFKDLQNPVIGKDARGLVAQFEHGDHVMLTSLRELSSGEKCYMIGALTSAAAETYGPIFCFWDEPDSHLALSEVGHFVSDLRRARKLQFIATSHNPEAISKFSDINTFVVDRQNHFAPPQIRPLSEVTVPGLGADPEAVADALLRGDLRLQ